MFVNAKGCSCRPSATCAGYDSVVHGGVPGEERKTNLYRSPTLWRQILALRNVFGRTGVEAKRAMLNSAIQNVVDVGVFARSAVFGDVAAQEE